MMLAWILTPIGRWLSLVGAVSAARVIARLKGLAAGRAAWETPDGKLRKPKPAPHLRRFDILFKWIAMLFLIVVSPAGYATEPRLNSDCDWAQPIRPSRKDVLTRHTKEQIAAHNEAGTRLCNWKANPAHRNTRR